MCPPDRYAAVPTPGPLTLSGDRAGSCRQNQLRHGPAADTCALTPCARPRGERRGAPWACRRPSSEPGKEPTPPPPGPRLPPPEHGVCPSGPGRLGRPVVHLRPAPHRNLPVPREDLLGCSGPANRRGVIRRDPARTRNRPPATEHTEGRLVRDVPARRQSCPPPDGKDGKPVAPGTGLMEDDQLWAGCRQPLNCVSVNAEPRHSTHFCCSPHWDRGPTPVGAGAAGQGRLPHCCSGLVTCSMLGDGAEPPPPSQGALYGQLGKSRKERPGGHCQDRRKVPAHGWAGGGLQAFPLDHSCGRAGSRPA